MARVELHNLGQLGVVTDIPGHQLPPEAWTSVKNVRFQDKNVTKFLGHQIALSTPEVPPGFIMNVPAPATSYWLYASLDKIYAYDNGVHTELTRASGDYIATNYEQWNGGILGGIPILNNGLESPQYWIDLSVGTPLDDLAGWPADVLAKVVRPYGPFLIALNITDDGDLFPHMIWWSHPADPGSVPVSWDYTNPIYDAGRRELTDVEGGPIRDGLMLRNKFMIYKENSTHWLQYTGGQFVMTSDMMLAASGILAPRCVALVNRGQQHFVATGEDIIVHNGQTAESVLDGRMRKFLQNDIDPLTYQTSFCVHNPLQREAWFCYPENGATYPSKALVWNYQYNTLQFRDFTGRHAALGFVQPSAGAQWDDLDIAWDTLEARWGEEGAKQLLYCSPEDEQFYELDKGYTFAGAPINFYIEREGLAIIGKDRQGQPKVSLSVRKLVTRLWPKITGGSTVSIRVGVKEGLHEDEGISWSAAQDFNPLTQKWVDFTANGKVIAVRIEGTTDQSFQLEGYDMEMELLGEF